MGLLNKICTIQEKLLTLVRVHANIHSARIVVSTLKLITSKVHVFFLICWYLFYIYIKNINLFIHAFYI